MNDELVCAEVVELVSDYLDGALPAPEAQRVAEHLAGCPGCEAYFEQVRATTEGLGRIAPGTLPPDVRANLRDAFRDARE
jgi:anti-sigma factor RsiW